MQVQANGHVQRSAAEWRGIIDKDRPRCTGSVISDIFFGKITKWNDRVIQGRNPAAKLLDRAMVVCNRPDARGTTYVFADYLSKVSPEWAKTFGWGTWVSWPVGYSGNGNQGVTDLVQQSAGAIAYVEFAYALENTLPLAPIMTRQGTWVEPDISDPW